MTVGSRLNKRLTQLAVGQHLPRRTVRVRLTLLYGALFLISGAALMGITYLLLVNAGFVFTTQSGETGPGTGQPASSSPTLLPLGVARPRPLSPAARKGQPLSLPTPAQRARDPKPTSRQLVAPLQAAAGRPAFTDSTTHPTAQTMARWSQVARCMRQHGVSWFPDPMTSVPSNLNLANISELSDRDGAILAFPRTMNMQSPAFMHAAAACGFAAAGGATPTAEDNRQHNRVLQELLIQSGIALAAMSLLSLALGWLVAGRVLQPLEDAYQAQRQFVANASHELRTPLARQRALIQVALADPQASFSSLRAANERVLVSEQQLEQMIDALLTLTRSQAGPERHEFLDLKAVASQTLLARESEAADRDLDLRATLATAPTNGDPRLVARLIANLIDNAMRHNIPGGYIDVSTGTRDRRAFVAITNTGPTIPPEEIHRLFQPFQRLGGTRTQHNNGQGLGLSIVQAIADAHRAEVTTRARPQGGLTIEVAFPPATGAGSGMTLPAWMRYRGPRASLPTD